MFIRFFVMFLMFNPVDTFSAVDGKLTTNKNSIESVLLKGGFSGIFDKNAKMFFIGQYENGNINRKVYYYEREFGNARMTKRVVIVSGNVYSGMYDVPNDPPVLREGVLIFSNQDDGCCISLKGEELPKEVLVDGEILELFK